MIRRRFSESSYVLCQQSPEACTVDDSLPRRLICEDAGFSCLDCGKAFHTKQALADHSFRKHGSKSNVRDKFAEPCCPVCLTYLWTRSRVIEHLGKSSRCLLVFLGFRRSTKAPLRLVRGLRLSLLELGMLKGFVGIMWPALLSELRALWRPSCTC